MNKNTRKKVQVDEEKIKRMIAGDEPIVSEPDNLGNQTSDQPPPTEQTSSKEVVPVIQGKKRQSKNSYSELFLKTIWTDDKRQTSIQLSESIYKRAEIILKSTKGLSMGLFINNVLLHHFEEYEQDIDNIRELYISKLSENV